MAEVATVKPPPRYMRVPCLSCHTHGEHHLVRVLGDGAVWRDGYQCACCSAVQLLPLPDAQCTQCGRVHQPNEPACAVRRCSKCGKRIDHPVHDLSVPDRDVHEFEDVR